jgi:V8-like Glu-specific endopeptidase
MLKVRKVIFAFLSLACSFPQNVSSSDRPFEKDSMPERHLPKDTRFMKEDSSKNLLVDDEIFDRIHDKALLNSPKYNSSTSYIEGKDMSVCSGTLVKLYKQDNQVIGDFLTAKHCLSFQKESMGYDNPKSIYQGLSSHSYKGNTGQGYLARFKPYESCIDPDSKADKALIRARLQNSNIEEDRLFDTSSKIVKNEVTEKTLGMMNHYPFGNTTQRVNEGFVNEKPSSSTIPSERKHEISSLPGSSGAGVFNSNGELFGIHSGGDPDSNTGKKVFYNVSDLEGISDDKKMEKIFEYNRLYTTSEEDLKYFKKCYKY